MSRRFIAVVTAAALVATGLSLTPARAAGLGTRAATAAAPFAAGIVLASDRKHRSHGDLGSRFSRKQRRGRDYHYWPRRHRGHAFGYSGYRPYGHGFRSHHNHGFRSYRPHGFRSHGFSRGYRY